MKLTLQLGVLSALNLGISFLFQWYVLIQMGAGQETDALFAAMTIPQLVLAVISASLMHVLVPLFAGECEQRLRHDAWAFLGLVGGLFSLLAVLLYFGAPWWVPLTVPGFDEGGQRLTVDLTRIQLLGMVFSAVNGVQWAFYHARRAFLWAEFAPLLASLLGLLLLVWALPRYGIAMAAWVATLRLGMQTLLLAPAMGWPVRPDFNSDVIREGWRRIKPLLAGTAYYKTDSLVDRFMLSMAGSGSLSLYYFGQQIYAAASQVLNKAIAVPLVPALSLSYKNKDKKGFLRSYRHALIKTGLVCFLGLLVLAVFGQTLLRYLVGYGNIHGENIDMLWWVMIWLGGMFIGGAVGQLSSSSFYAVGDTVTPTRVGIYSYTVYIPVKITCFMLFGVAGLALSTSLFVVVNFLIQHFLIQKYLSVAWGSNGNK